MRALHSEALSLAFSLLSSYKCLLILHFNIKVDAVKGTSTLSSLSDIIYFLYIVFKTQSIWNIHDAFKLYCLPDIDPLALISAQSPCCSFLLSTDAHETWFILGEGGLFYTSELFRRSCEAPLQKMQKDSVSLKTAAQNLGMHQLGKKTTCLKMWKKEVCLRPTAWDFICSYKRHISSNHTAGRWADLWAP